MSDLSKAAEAAAVFLNHADGHELSRIKLMKLLYLADRQAIAEYGSTISNDRLVAMPFGPALSRTLSAMRHPESAPREWSRWVLTVPPHTHRLAPGADVAEVAMLSDAEISVIDQTWARFGSWDQWDLKNWTHDPANIPEWTDPQGSSFAITLEELGRAVGMPETEVQALVEQQKELEEVHRTLSAL